MGGKADGVTFCSGLPQLDAVARKFGGLYVMEGSTLGGRLISRLAAEQGYTPKRGCSYFFSYGDKAG